MDIEQKSQPKPEEEKMGLTRAILAVGFMIILLGVGIGAATGGSDWAKYVALAGLGCIGISIAMTIVEKLSGKGSGKAERTSS